MKRTANGHRAHELETIQAVSVEGYSNKAIYVIEGLPGFYRRLTQKAGAANPERIVAFFGETLIDLVAATSINSEFTEAGYSEHKKALVLPSQVHPALTMPVPTIPEDLPEPPEDENKGSSGELGLGTNEVIDPNTGEVFQVESSDEASSTESVAVAVEGSENVMV